MESMELVFTSLLAYLMYILLLLLLPDLRLENFAWNMHTVANTNFHDAQDFTSKAIQPILRRIDT